MERQFSAGIIIYHEGVQGREYLVIRYGHGHWDFAKGHIEAGESKEQAALRELEEETGIAPKDVQLNSNFEKSFEYFFRHDGQLVLKKVYFFIGKSTTQTVTLSFEHTEYKWLSFPDALKQLTYDNAKELLREVEQYLNLNN